LKKIRLNKILAIGRSGYVYSTVTLLARFLG